MATNVCHRRVLALLKRQGGQLDRLYARKSREIAQVLKRYDLKDEKNVWKRNSAVEKEIEKILLGLDDELKAFILENVGQGQTLANNCIDLTVDRYTSGMDMTAQQRESFYFRNGVVLASYIDGVSRKLNLSSNVWNVAEQSKEQIEFFLRDGLANGTSATEIASDLKKFLKEPDRRFRRIRDENGVLQLSNPAKDYHPGRGVYRSSYKNALRLARNEINIAYRATEFDRIQELDFVKGIRVNLSNAHPRYDICDELQGLYPKKFRFLGWHPNCLCFTTTVLMQPNEFVSALNRNDFSNVSGIRSIPRRAQTYLNQNKDSFERLKSRPYWFENFKNTRDGYTLKANITR